MKFFLVFNLFLSVMPVALHGQSREGYFDGEDRFSRPVQISPTVADTIRKDKNFQDCLPYGQAIEQFEATTFDLNRDRTTEIVVKGPCGNSATSFYYWF